MIELEAEKEARWRMHALSREDWALQEFEKIAFCNGPVTGKLKPIEPLGNYIGLFTPKEVLEKKITADEMKSFIELKLITLFVSKILTSTVVKMWMHN